MAEQNGGRVRQRPREETDTHGTLLPAPCPSLPRSVPNPWASIPARPAAANSLSGLTLAMSQWENSEGARPVVINHQAAALAPTPSPWLEIGSRQTDQTDRGQGSLRDRRASRQPRLCMMDLQTVRISPSPHSLRAFTGVSRRWEATASTDGVPPVCLNRRKRAVQTCYLFVLSPGCTTHRCGMPPDTFLPPGHVVPAWIFSVRGSHRSPVNVTYRKLIVPRSSRADKNGRRVGHHPVSRISNSLDESEVRRSAASACQ